MNRTKVANPYRQIVRQFRKAGRRGEQWPLCPRVAQVAFQNNVDGCWDGSYSKTQYCNDGIAIEMR